MVIPVITNGIYSYNHLYDQIYFPHPEISTSDGLVAMGGHLDTNHLLLAYQFGLFPWYNEGEPILWWSPKPRCVLLPRNIVIQKSMRSLFNQRKYRISINQAFEQVMRACMTIDRKKQKGTWINEEMIAAYTKLHSQGYAHSIEVYHRDKLIGGLYGVCLGKIFYGESMFAHERNTSKMALISLCLVLQEMGFWIIDCQQDTEHIQSMGAETIGYDHFRKLLLRNVFEPQIDPEDLSQYDPYELWQKR